MREILFRLFFYSTRIFKGVLLFIFNQMIITLPLYNFQILKSHRIFELDFISQLMKSKKNYFIKLQESCMFSNDDQAFLMNQQQTKGLKNIYQKYVQVQGLKNSPYFFNYTQNDRNNTILLFPSLQCDIKIINSQGQVDSKGWYQIQLNSFNLQYNKQIDNMMDQRIRKTNKTKNFGQIDDDFEPYFKAKSSRRRKTQKRWTKQENETYAKFLKEHKEMFRDQVSRRCLKVFKKIQAQIQTKTSCQCKSHHQKMMRKYQTIQKIIIIHEQMRRNSTFEDYIESKFEKKAAQHFETPTQNYNVQDQNDSVFLNDDNDDSIYNVLELSISNRPWTGDDQASWI